MTSEVAGKPKTYVHGLMLLMAFLVASSFPVGAAITNALPPEVMMFFRFLAAATLFGPYVFIKNGLNIPSAKTLLGYAALSIPLVVFFWCMFESLRYTSMMNTGAIYTTVPAITALFAFFINRESGGRTRALGLMVGTLGALWILFRGDLSALIKLDLNKGDLIFLVGCLFLGVYNPLVKKTYAGEPMEVMTFWVTLLGSGWLFILSANSLAIVDWQGVETRVYLGVLYLSVFATLLTFFLLQLGTVNLGATKVAAYGFLTPIFVIALGLIFGLDSIELATLPGIGLVFVAMYLIQIRKKRV